MKARLTQIAGRINALGPRERVLTMLAVLAVVAGLWQVGLFGPLQSRQAALQRQAKALHRSIAKLNQSITAAADKRAQNPDAALRAEIATVKTDNRQLGKKLDAITAGLVAPREMTALLERVLKARHGLKLIGVANLPARRLDIGGANKTGKAKIFSHGMTLTFEGGYLDTLEYLKALEALPWHFYWDSLDFEVKDYPVGRVTLTVHTLNLKMGWIGV
jgi:MSHA biogenesis protein MshJ